MRTIPVYESDTVCIVARKTSGFTESIRLFQNKGGKIIELDIAEMIINQLKKSKK